MKKKIKVNVQMNWDVDSIEEFLDYFIEVRKDLQKVLEGEDTQISGTGYDLEVIDN